MRNSCMDVRESACDDVQSRFPSMKATHEPQSCLPSPARNDSAATVFSFTLDPIITPINAGPVI